MQVSIDCDHDLADKQAGRDVLAYAVGPWADLIGRATLFPEIVLTFEVAPGESHYPLALLFAGHSYTAYRGS